ncbi:MAG: hypothetical protein QF886_25085, partial [Planctomycetota bacterium]|nr:hypothetical protein [Planctomycetota bacterium]
LPATEKYPWLRGMTGNYGEFALRGCEQAVEQAVASLQPISVSIGAELDGRVAFNRRYVMRDGTATMMGKGGDILHVEG